MQFDWKYAKYYLNKAYLRDLIAATGLIILLKLDWNQRLFSPFDLEIWQMTSKVIGQLSFTTSSFVHHFKSISAFRHELQSGNPLNWRFLSLVTLRFDGWIWKRIVHLFYTASSFVHQFKVCEWVIKFNSLSGNSRQRGPCSLYKPCNHSQCIGIIFFPHIDNTESTAHN